MPVRIYALAKDLKIDSKELVDLCTKAGITGKGSALASLTDEELVKVKAFLSGGPKKPDRKDSGMAPPVLPLSGQSASPAIPVLPPSPPPPPKAPPAPSVPSAAPVELPPAPEVSEEPEELVAPAPPVTMPPPAIAIPVSPAAVTSASPVSLAPSAAPASLVPPPALTVGAPAATAASGTATLAPPTQARPDFFPSGPKQIRVLGAPQPKRSADGRGEGDDRKPKKRTPVINVAPMPEVRQPTPHAKSNEPAPQKPEIRLPKDAITSHKRGDHGPLESHVQKAEKRREQEKAAETHKDKDRAKPTKGPEAGRDRTETPAAAKAAKGVRKGKEVETEEPERDKRGMAGMSTLRADRQKARKLRVTKDGKEEEDRPTQRKTIRRTHSTSTAAPRKERIVIELPCTVRSFSEAAGIQASQVLRVLMGLGQMVNINAAISHESADLVALELGLQVEFKQPETLEERLSRLEQLEDSPESLQPRTPIVTFLGHVDHGKTSLLDRLVGTNLVPGEAGGITQHIRAYQVDKEGRRVTFVDTPGHEAFTEMRARGANVTDIAIVVIAANDGIMPQTEEAISHAKAAGVPIVVAMNKIDLPGVDQNRILTQMTQQGLTPSAWGGDVEVVPTSALTGAGLDELLETLLTVAELHELKANPDRPGVGVCIEAEQESGRGVMAKVVVRNGTVRVGDVIVCGAAHGRIKAMYDTLDPRKKLESAGPAFPVNIAGLDVPPAAGDRLYVIDDIAEAREIAEQRADLNRFRAARGSSRVSFEHFQELLQGGNLGRKDEVAVLNVIVRADVRGSLEAIDKELSKLEHPEVRINVLQRAVGGITVGDVTLADASQAVIVGFNVIPDEAARQLSEDRQVQIRRYNIIYQLTDDLKAMLEGKLKPEQKVVELGRAVVKQMFQISRVGVVAGCYVAHGTIERNCRIRVNREGRTIGDYALESLKREKDDAKSVARGMECGIKLAGFNDIKKDDMLEAYKIEEVARTL